MARSALTIMAAIIGSAFVFATPARALSVQDFNNLSVEQQAHCVTNFLEKMTADISTVNPGLAQQMRDWFARKQEGKPVSEGLERLFVELGATDIQTKQGRVDPSKIEVESVIVWVVKQKFPPSQQSAPSASPAPRLVTNDFETKAFNEQIEYQISLTKRLMANPSVKEFETWIPAQQSAYLAKLAEDISRNTEDSQKLNAMLTEATESRLTELNKLAQQGKTDLSEIYIRDVLLDALGTRIDAEQAHALKQKQEIEARAIKLHDGRHAYVDGNNFRDDNGVVLQGADRDEAEQEYRRRLGSNSN